MGTEEESTERDKQQYVFRRAFQIAAEESGGLVFIYDLATQTIHVDPSTEGRGTADGLWIAVGCCRGNQASGYIQ